MHSNRMRTARSLPYRRVSVQGCLWQRGLLGKPPGQRPPSPLWTDWQTWVKTLPCPKLHLWAVKEHFSRMHTACFPIINALATRCIDGAASEQVWTGIQWWPLDVTIRGGQGWRSHVWCPQGRTGGPMSDVQGGPVQGGPMHHGLWSRGNPLWTDRQTHVKTLPSHNFDGRQ